MLYLNPPGLYGAVPNEKQGLLYILRHVIIWATERCDGAVEISSQEEI